MSASHGLKTEIHSAKTEIHDVKTQIHGAKHNFASRKCFSNPVESFSRLVECLHGPFGSPTGAETGLTTMEFVPTDPVKTFLDCEKCFRRLLLEKQGVKSCQQSP